MAFKPYCPDCNTWHTEKEGHIRLNQKAIEVIADYLDACEVEDFVDEEFSQSAAKDILGLLEDAGLVLAAGQEK